MQVYSVTGGVQAYSVTNYSTCCFLLHLQLSKNYIKELSWTQHSNTAYLNSVQTDKQTYNNSWFSIRTHCLLDNFVSQFCLNLSLDALREMKKATAMTEKSCFPNIYSRFLDINHDGHRISAGSISSNYEILYHVVSSVFQSKARNYKSLREFSKTGRTTLVLL